MSKTLDELKRDLKSLRLSGMADSLDARAMQFASGDMPFVEMMGTLLQDELDRRESRLLIRRLKQSGLEEKKSLREFDWTFNPSIPKRNILELATLKFVDQRFDAILLGKPGTGKSHVAKALALSAVERGIKTVYRDAYNLIEELAEARIMGDMKKVKSSFVNAELLIIDDLFLRPLPDKTGSDLTDILFMRYEKRSTIITSNRPFEDWVNLLGDVVVVAPVLDRLMHHGHLLRFEGKSWRLKEAAERATKEPQAELALA